MRWDRNGFSLMELVVTMGVVSLVAFGTAQMLSLNQRMYSNDPKLSANKIEGLGVAAKRVMADAGGQGALVNLLSQLDPSYAYLHQPVAMDLALLSAADKIPPHLPGVRVLKKDPANADNFIFTSIEREETDSFFQLISGLSDSESVEFYRDELASLATSPIRQDGDPMTNTGFAIQGPAPLGVQRETGISNFYVTWPIPEFSVDRTDNDTVRAKPPLMMLRGDTDRTRWLYDPRSTDCGNSLRNNRMVIKASSSAAAPPKAKQLVVLRSAGNSRIYLFQEITQVEGAAGQGCISGLHYPVKLGPMSSTAWRSILPTSASPWANVRGSKIAWPKVAGNANPFSHAWFAMGGATLFFEPKANNAVSVGFAPIPKCSVPGNVTSRVAQGQTITIADNFNDFACLLLAAGEQLNNPQLEKIIVEPVRLSALWVKKKSSEKLLVATHYVPEKVVPGDRGEVEAARFTSLNFVELSQPLSGSVVAARRIGNSAIQLFFYEGSTQP